MKTIINAMHDHDIYPLILEDFNTIYSHANKLIQPKAKVLSYIIYCQQPRQQLHAVNSTKMINFTLLYYVEISFNARIELSFFVY